MKKEVTDVSASFTNKTAVFKKSPIYLINIIYIYIYHEPDGHVEIQKQ